MRENRETRDPPNVGGGRSGKAAPKPDMYVPWGVGCLHSTCEAGEQSWSPDGRSVEEKGDTKGNAGSTLLVPDTGPGTCEHRRGQRTAE